MDNADKLLSPPSVSLTLLIIEICIALTLIFFAFYKIHKFKPLSYGLKTKFMAILEIFNATTAIFAISFLFVRFGGLVIRNKASSAIHIVDERIQDIRTYAEISLDACNKSFEFESKTKNNRSEILKQDLDCVLLFKELISAVNNEQSIGRFVELKSKFSRINDLPSTGDWTSQYDKTIHKLDDLIVDSRTKNLYANPQSPSFEVWIVVSAFFLLSISLIAKLFKSTLEYKEATAAKNIIPNRKYHPRQRNLVWRRSYKCKKT